MDVQLFALLDFSYSEEGNDAEVNCVWVHPDAAHGSQYCTAFFSDKQAVLAIRVNSNINPSCFYLSQPGRQFLKCDYANARVYFKDVDVLFPNPVNDLLVLDVQIANQYWDKAILNAAYDADQMRCEMLVLYHKTVFTKGMPLAFTHRNVLFHVTPQQNFMFVHGVHQLKLTHAANTCFTLTGSRTSLADMTPYISVF